MESHTGSRISLRPEKFNGNDWHFWKEQMQSVFTLEGLWEVVSGTEKNPAGLESGSATATVGLMAGLATSPVPDDECRPDVIVGGLILGLG